MFPVKEVLTHTFELAKLGVGAEVTNIQIYTQISADSFLNIKNNGLYNLAIYGYNECFGTFWKTSCFPLLLILQEL